MVVRSGDRGIHLALANREARKERSFPRCPHADANARIAIGLAVLLSAAPALAQQSPQTHVINPSAVRQAVADQIAVDAANRAAVTQVLHRDDVRSAAEQMGLNLTRAEQALSTLDSTDLAKLATPARAINGADRAGGDVVVISVTTLLLVLILLVLILK